MRVLITEKGIHDAKGNQLVKGSEVEIKGDELPDTFVNKCQILPEGGKKSKGGKLIVNPAEGAGDADLLAQAKELGIADADNLGEAELKAAIDAALAA